MIDITMSTGALFSLAIDNAATRSKANVACSRNGSDNMKEALIKTDNGLNILMLQLGHL